MRMCKDLTSANTMAEVMEELTALNSAMDEIVGDYCRAAELDPDYIELKKYQAKARRFMQAKVAQEMNVTMFCKTPHE